KLAAKIVLADNVSLTLGAGAMYHGDTEHHATIGADAGVVFAIAHLPLFVAPRVIFARPIWVHDVYENGGVIEILAVPIRYRHALSNDWAFRVELAPLAGVQTSRSDNPSMTRLITDTHVGGYGAIAFEYRP